ncbi:MAG: hypothetical protein Q7S40_34850 [Opitutaceae bacterium]|nr:hypothetical protein [Opitutaceae bacterium]
MSLGYGYALNRASCEALNGLPRRSRERLLDFFRRLAESPFTEGDYHETDERGFAVEVMLVHDQFLVTWHVDHPVKEVRIVGLEIV